MGGVSDRPQASPDSDYVGNVFDAEVFLGEESLVGVSYPESSGADLEIHQIDWRRTHR